MMRYALSVLLLGIIVQAPSLAAEKKSCRCCGACCKNLKAICVLKCEMVDKKETCYGIKCEDFCLPGLGKKCGCEHIPTCDGVRTKRVLVKRECKTKVPEYKCVVEYVCPACCQHNCHASNPIDPVDVAQSGGLHFVQN